VLGRFAPLLFFALCHGVLACGENADPAGTGGVAGSAGAPADASADASATGDELTFESILRGEIDAAKGLFEIARSDGWPIATPDGFVFARLDDGAGPYQLAGDFNAWQPAELAHEAGLYWTRLSIAEPDGAKYKYVDASDGFASDPLSRRYAYDEFGEVSLVRAESAHLERWFELSAPSIPPRTVRVWVPASPSSRHLYVHDGQNLFDPSAPFGGWKLAESAGASTLLVGIDNAGALRMDEYTHVPDVIGGSPTGGNADAYVAFVIDAVRPLIEARYGAPSKVGVMGLSLGGLVAFHQVVSGAGEWDFAASLSGTFGWGSIGANNATLIERVAAAGKLPVTLYLDSGGGPGSGCVDSDGDGIFDDAPDSADNYCETEQMKQTLETLGWQHDVDLFHWFEPGAAHDEAAWAARVWRPLERFEAL
jgi:hypothetical protein